MATHELLKCIGTDADHKSRDTHIGSGNEDLQKQQKQITQATGDVEASLDECGSVRSRNLVNFKCHGYRCTRMERKVAAVEGAEETT